MAARKNRSVTLAEVRRWPPTVDVAQAAEALGVSRAGAYNALSEGRFPVATITVGHKIRVLTHSLISVLEGTDQQAISA